VAPRKGPPPAREGGLMTDLSLMSGEPDPELTAHPQPAFKLLRDAGPAVDKGEGRMVIGGGHAEVRHVLGHPEIFSSGIDAVTIGQVRPLIPLQIDPPHHRNYRKLLDPIFAPRQIALLEARTRALVPRPRAPHPGPGPRPRAPRLRQGRLKLPRGGGGAATDDRVPPAPRSPARAGRG